MSNLVTDTSRIKEHHHKNHIQFVRVIGMILDYDAMNARITIKSLSTLASTSQMIYLTMDDDLLLSDPELCYAGTVVDVNGLYDGKTVRILSIRVVNMDIDEQQRQDLHYVANLKKDPL